MGLEAEQSRSRDQNEAESADPLISFFAAADDAEPTSQVFLFDAGVCGHKSEARMYPDWDPWVTIQPSPPQQTHTHKQVSVTVLSTLQGRVQIASNVIDFNCAPLSAKKNTYPSHYKRHNLT
jgi:hypothetical protein